MAKKVTEENIRRRTFQIHGGALIYVSGLVNWETPCLWFCCICCKLWYASPSHVLRKKRATKCPACSKRLQSKSYVLPLKEFLQRLQEVWGNLIEYVSGYAGAVKKCKFRCMVCGHEWEASPSNLLKKGSGIGTGHYGCPECYYASQRTSKEDMLTSLYKVWGNLIIYIGCYFSLNKKCKWKCAVCGYEWENTPNKLIKRHVGCPHCRKHSMETPVMEFLMNKGVVFRHNRALKGCYYRNPKHPLRADFYFDCGLVIECDGKQHVDVVRGEEGLKEIQTRDQIKNMYCKNNNICIIRVTNSRFWGTEKHILMKKLFELLELGIDENGNIDIDVFRPYDFNRCS